MFKLFRREPRTSGLIAHLGLVSWWENDLTPEERDSVLTRYQPMGGDSTSLITGEIQYTSRSALHLLWGLAGWFKKPEDFPLAQKIFAAGSKLLQDSPVLDVHFFHHARIEFFYRLRDLIPEAKALAETACRDQIAIAPQAAAAFRAQYGPDDLPAHTGFRQLAILLEKDGRVHEAIQVCQVAHAGGWPGDWLSRAEKLTKKLSKPTKK